MRLAVLALIFLTAVGCQHTAAPAAVDPNRNAAGQDQVLTTDKGSYAAGAPVTLRLANSFSYALGYNLCTATLERRSGESWRTAEYENERVCTMELRTVQPGSTATQTLQLDARLPAGEYRYRASVENMRSGGRQQLTSNTFRVTR